MFVSSNFFFHRWQIKHDASLEGSTINDQPAGCFEVVSPILSGEDGLRDLATVLTTLKEKMDIRVDKKCGVHVHINGSDLNLSSLKAICANWTKYEEGIDSMVPASRREDNNGYLQSNKNKIPGNNQEKFDRIFNCETIEDLQVLFCGPYMGQHHGRPCNRYTKLNLVNLRPGASNTIEFRNHGGSWERKKISNWIRFCVQFVEASLARCPGDSLRDDRDAHFQREFLFKYVVKDTSLRDYFEKRARHLGSSPHS